MKFAQEDRYTWISTTPFPFFAAQNAPLCDPNRPLPLRHVKQVDCKSTIGQKASQSKYSTVHYSFKPILDTLH